MKKHLFLLPLVLTFTIQIKAQSKNYFPLSSKDTSALSSFTVKWYSSQLAAMNEPVIFNNKTPGIVIYRFTWLRTFHHPITIRIEKHDDSFFLYWKQCDGAGGYNPGKLITDKQKQISKNVWDKLVSQLALINFWEMSTNNLKVLGNDGSQWILEGKLNDKYHVVDRWTPGASDTYYKCCYYLVELTDLKIKDNERY